MKKVLTEKEEKRKRRDDEIKRIYKTLSGKENAKHDEVIRQFMADGRKVISRRTIIRSLKTNDK